MIRSFVDIAETGRWSAQALPPARKDRRSFQRAEKLFGRQTPPHLVSGQPQGAAVLPIRGSRLPLLPDEAHRGGSGAARARHRRKDSGRAAAGKEPEALDQRAFLDPDSGVV